MNNINSYIIINKKTNFITKIFIYISLSILISLTIVLNFNYKKYYYTKSNVTKINSNYNLVLYLSPEKLKIIKNNDSVFIDNKKYNYKINSISNEYIISNDFNNYIEVILDINLKEKDKINNNILEIKFLESNKKLFYYLKEYLKEGVKR